MPKKKGKKPSKKDEEAAAAEEAERLRREAEEKAAAEARAVEEARREAEEAARREAAEKARRERPFSIVVRTRCLPFCKAPTVGPRNITLTVREVDRIAAVKQQLVALTRASHKVTVRRIMLAYPPARASSESWDDMDNEASLVDYGVALPRDFVGAFSAPAFGGPVAVLRLSLDELRDEDLKPVGPAYADPWRYSALDRSLMRTAPRGSVFDLQRYEEEMEKMREFQRRTPAEASMALGEDAEADEEREEAAEAGEGSEDSDSEGDSEEDAMAAPPMPSNNHELLASLTLRTGELTRNHGAASNGNAEADRAPGKDDLDAYDPVAALRSAMAFQKRRKATAKLLR